MNLISLTASCEYFSWAIWVSCGKLPAAAGNVTAVMVSNATVLVICCHMANYPKT